VQYATLLLHSAFYHSVLSTSKITFTSTYIVSTAMSPSEKSLLQRALIDRRQQVFELATSSNALSDLGAELLFLSDGPQKTRMMASLHAANSLIKKQLLEASLVCKVVEINVTPPSTDSAGEKQSGSMLTQLMGIPSVHGDMTVQKALELMGAATAEYSSNRTKLMPFMTVLRKADANSTVEEALEMVQAMALKPDNSEVIVSYIHYGTTEQEADTHSQTPAETADHEESIEDATLDGSSIKTAIAQRPEPVIETKDASIEEVVTKTDNTIKANIVDDTVAVSNEKPVTKVETASPKELATAKDKPITNANEPSTSSAKPRLPMAPPSPAVATARGSRELSNTKTVTQHASAVTTNNSKKAQTTSANRDDKEKADCPD
jgi:hypothetical protein